MDKRNDSESGVILFTSAKGGSGCSFLVNSVASYLALKTTANILLLDMNIGKRDSRTVFDIDEKISRDFGDIEEIVKNMNTQVLKKLVLNLRSSLNIILPPLKMDKTGILREENLNIFIECLRDHFDIILVDMPYYLLSSINIVEVDIADRIVFVTLPDVYSAGNCRILMNHIEHIRPGIDWYMVVNKYNIRVPISPAGLANILQYPVTTFIPYDRDIQFLVQTRGPFHMFNYNLRIVKSIKDFSMKIYEELLK
jgi:Flp pilus assembly CpaE family ATPase